ncbi:MAG TPA: hypothetical protein PLH02_04755 [Bacillota bacterium]|nr:hypothetical protein [Bacillota bacterium]HPQ62159.1 hypothetical protein [Bacillota bacterium]
MMRILENKRFVLIFRIVFLIGILAGLVIMIIKREYPWQMFNYFSLLSNIAVLAMILILVINRKKAGKWLIVAKQTVTVMILVTSILFFLTLLHYTASAFFGMITTWEYFFIYIFTPVMMLIDFILFDRVEKLILRDSLWSLSACLLYFSFAEIFAVLDGVITYGIYYSFTLFDLSYFIRGGAVIQWICIAGIIAGVFVLSFGMDSLHNFLQQKKKEEVV